MLGFIFSMQRINKGLSKLLFIGDGCTQNISCEQVQNKTAGGARQKKKKRDKKKGFNI